MRFKRVEYPSISVSMRTAEGRKLGVFRFCLIRYAEGPDNFQRFTFVAAPTVTPYDASDSTIETVCYHLFNICWSYRTRIVGRHLARLTRLPPNDAQEAVKAVASLKDDLRAVTADSQVRGLDPQTDIYAAIPEDKRDEARRLLTQVWPPLKSKLFKLIEAEPPDIPQLVSVLKEIDPINRFLYKAALDWLSGNSK